MLTKHSLIDNAYVLSCLAFGIGCLYGISAIIFVFIPFRFSNGKFERLPTHEIGYAIPVSVSIPEVPDTVINYSNGTHSFGTSSYLSQNLSLSNFDGNDVYIDSMKRAVESDSSYKKTMTVNRWVATPGISNRTAQSSIGGNNWFEIVEKEVAQSALVPMISAINTTVEIRVRGKTQWQNFMLSLHSYLGIFVYIFISFHVMRLLQKWRREIYFLENLHKKLELIGKVLIYSQILYFIFLFVYAKYFGSIRLVSASTNDTSTGPINIHINPTTSASFMPFFIGVGLFILSRVIQYGQDIEIEIEELEEQQIAKDLANAQLRQNILELENNFLRAQINPHFLYNTLNVFYAQAQPLSEALSNSILTLAKIMRYSLETTQGGHLVPLEMEVAHLRRVISIHQLRFDNQLQINFTVEEPLGEVKIVPLIFITLLENALKHGEASDPDSPIALWLAADTSRIYFTIRNKIGNQSRDRSLGIGMENIKKRLQAVYGERHQFDVENKDGIYQVVLVIEHACTDAG